MPSPILDSNGRVYLDTLGRPLGTPVAPPPPITDQPFADSTFWTDNTGWVD